VVGFELGLGQGKTWEYAEAGNLGFGDGWGMRWWNGEEGGVKERDSRE
jgi:hypothetical protein